MIFAAQRLLSFAYQSDRVLASAYSVAMSDWMLGRASFNLIGFAMDQTLCGKSGDNTQAYW